MTIKDERKSACVATKQVVGCFFTCSRTDRVIRALDAVMDKSDSQKNPIEEQLKQCPEAFQAGELLEKALNSLKYDSDEVDLAERWLPPAGAIIPPLV